MRNQSIRIKAVSLAALLAVFACAPSSERLDFQDCDECPEMAVIPAGSFMMGTSKEGRVNDLVSGRYSANEEPQHRVTISNSFAIGKFEVTVAEFRNFVEESSYTPKEYFIAEKLKGINTISVSRKKEDRSFGFSVTDSARKKLEEELDFEKLNISDNKETDESQKIKSEEKEYVPFQFGSTYGTSSINTLSNSSSSAKSSWSTSTTDAPKKH